MKVWASIFNIIAILILSMLVIVYYNEAVHNEIEFQEIRLKTAVSYSAEAAFLSTISVEDLGIEYGDMASVIINPGDSLDVFESMMCLNYNMSPSDENKAHIESYIPCAVLACNNGYYITTMSEVVTTPLGNEIGKEYQLKWSIKKPYAITVGNTAYAVNINNQDWVSARDSAGALEIKNGKTYPAGINKNMILREVNSHITQDMEYQIDKANINRKSWDYKFYLPPVQTSTGVNPITKPSLLILVQGVDFASTHKIDLVDVAGLKTVRNRVVIAFKDPATGNKYYCYEGQLDNSLANYVDDYYERIEDAAQDGYMPNYEYLQKPIDYN